MDLRKIRAAAPAALAAAGLAAVLVSAPAAHAQTAYAIANGGTSLIRFNVSNPTAATLVGNFSGAYTALDAIDFRPLNGGLYGYVDATDTLYSVNLNTAVLTAVTGNSLKTNTFLLGMDFNPTIDRVRVVTDSTQNIVLDPNGVAAPVNGTALAYGAGDAATASQYAGAGVHVLDNAYTNNIAGAFSGTQQYGIETGVSSLVTIANNAGTLATVGGNVGNLGLNLSGTSYIGFDIYTTFAGVNTAYGVFDTSGNGSGSSAGLYTINLATGAASSVGRLGSFTQVYSLAITPNVAPEPGSLALLVGALATMSVPVYRRRRRRA